MEEFRKNVLPSEDASRLARNELQERIDATPNPDAPQKTEKELTKEGLKAQLTEANFWSIVRYRRSTLRRPMPEGSLQYAENDDALSVRRVIGPTPRDLVSTFFLTNQIFVEQNP